jgi:hypothetical protein
MLRTISFIGAVTVCCSAAAEDGTIGCFSDGGYVVLHGGITYQYFVDKGEKPVDCTPAAVQAGLELAEAAAQASCVTRADSLCEQKKQYVALIRGTYGALLEADAAAPAAAEAAAVAPAAGTPGTADKPPGDKAAEPVELGARATIRWVQTSLQQLGYDPGSADGALGRRTVAAIRKYEKDNGLPVTGKMSVALVDSLKRRAGQR